MIGSIDLAVPYYQNQRKTLGVNSMPCNTSGNAGDRRGNPSHQARPDGGITWVTMVQRGEVAFTDSMG